MSRANFRGTCTACRRPVFWLLLTNGTYRSCELQPVQAAHHHPGDVFAYRKSLAAWVDLGSVVGAPPVGMLAHFCPEYRDPLRDVSTIGDILSAVAADVAAEDRPGGQEPGRGVATSW
jgi:hypothetical protein